MNTHELREAEQNELKAIGVKMNSGDWEAAFEERQAVKEKYRILRAEITILNDWYFPAEEWATLSQEAKKAIVNMAQEAYRYEELREDLQGWLAEAP
jgi:hypothetical protein